MKPEIHPQYKDVTVTCSCGSVFTTRSTLGKESIALEVCAKCHPFYTGTQKMVDTAGRVDRFRQKYGLKGKNAAQEAAPAKAEVKASAPATAEAPAKVEAAKPESKKAEGKKKPAAKKADDKKE